MKLNPKQHQHENDKDHQEKPLNHLQQKELKQP